MPGGAFAQGDTVVGTRSEKLVERSHRVSITMNRGHARLVVQRTVFNGGPRHDQATFHLYPPEGSVAVGLRTAGVSGGVTRWFDGDLLEAEAAAAKYQELTGLGGYYPKDPALLSWRSQGHLALQVFPCPPQQPKTVEYTLVAPTEYRDGAHHFTLPAMGTTDLLASVTVTSSVPHASLFVDGQPIAPGSGVKLNAQDPRDLSLVPQRPEPVSGALASYTAGSQRVLTRFRIEAAPKLTEVPSRAQVVVVLDASRSMENTLSAQRAAAQAYLSHFRDAQVKIMSFDRAPRYHHTGFLPVAQARRVLASLRLTPSNGSHVDEALLAADHELSRITRDVPRRIVLFTDARTRSALTPATIAASVRRSGAVVHVAVLDEGTPSLMRTDEHEWSKPIRSTGGLVWQATAEGGRAADAAPVFEELVRPIRIDHLTVDTSVLAREEIEQPDRLDEGQGLTYLGVTSRASAQVRVRGELWSAPYEHTIAADEAESKLWSALVFGSDAMHGLSEAEMMTLAMHGGAVSPVTSYLAIEPGVRPSTEGLLWGEEVGSAFGAGGLGLSGVGMGGGGSGFGTFDPDAYLRSELAQSWAQCGGTPNTAVVTLETTFTEVVDVPSAQFDGDVSKQRCLLNGAWALSLPSEFVWPWRSWTIAI